MAGYSLENILALIEGDYAVQGRLEGDGIDSAKTIGEAGPDSLAWIDPARADKQTLLDSTHAGVVVCDNSVSLPDHALEQRVLIQVANPKLTFIRVVAALFEPKPAPGIHPSAVIHPEAQLADDVFVGPLTYIGRAQVGPGCTIYGNVHIYDNISLGRNVTVQAGCVLGVAGFSLAKDEQGDFQNFPHLGGLRIEDDVELQALCIVDRGVLSDTVIGAGSKINSGCYVGHNVRIGRRNFIAGHSMICGSVVTGDDCWFGPSCVVRDQLRIGANCFVGTGSVVVASLDESSRVMGNPARPIEEAKRILSKLKQL